MKKNLAFLAIICILCGLFYFYKTKTEKENRILVQNVVQLKENSNIKLQNIIDRKKEYEKQIEELKNDIDKSNEELSNNNKKLKTINNIPANKKRIETINQKIEELNLKINNLNKNLESLTKKVDEISEFETSFATWRQQAFDILGKTQIGSLKKEDKLKLTAVSKEYKELEESINKINTTNQE